MKKMAGNQSQKFWQSTATDASNNLTLRRGEKQLKKLKRNVRMRITKISRDSKKS